MIDVGQLLKGRKSAKHLDIDILYCHYHSTEQAMKREKWDKAKMFLVGGGKQHVQHKEDTRVEIRVE